MLKDHIRHCVVDAVERGDGQALDDLSPRSTGFCNEGGPHLRVAQKPAILLAVAAAALYGLSAPVSKLLLGSVGRDDAWPRCCIWARARGLLAVRLAQRALGAATREAPLTRRDLPATVAMVALDIAAPVLLMAGLARTSAANAAAAEQL